MPHLTLKYSKNLPEKDFTIFFSKAHELLAQLLAIKIDSCRSLATPYEHHFIGDGSPENGFIHLEILIKSGQTPVLMQALGIQMLELLKSHLIESNSVLKLKTSLEIQEVGSYYFS